MKKAKEWYIISNKVSVSCPGAVECYQKIFISIQKFVKVSKCYTKDILTELYMVKCIRTDIHSDWIVYGEIHSN